MKEMRAMNMALHGLGLRVVLDVVYNHTNAAGLNDNSVFDKIVPGYYHRYNPVSGAIERSTCCDNTATEHAMMQKFVEDSLVTLATAYKFDGFRFDIMGHHPKAGILAARTAVQKVDADTYFYGEGWNFGEVANDALFTQARQANMAGTEVGTFNDRPRDAVRGAKLFANDGDVGTKQQQNYIEIGLAGTLKDFVLKDYQGDAGTASGVIWNSQPAGYATDPADIINYVSKHDNESLWDKLQLELAADVSLSERVRIHNIALAIPPVEVKVFLSCNWAMICYAPSRWIEIVLMRATGLTGLILVKTATTGMLAYHWHKITKPIRTPDQNGSL